MTTETTQPSRLDKIRPFMAWVVLPAILAMVAGVFVNYKVPWLHPGAVALLLLSAAPLWPVITAKPSNKVNWVGFFWLAVHVMLFATAGYLEWDHLKWPISPWLGFGTMIVVWVLIVLGIAQLKASETSAKPHAREVPIVSEGAVKVSNTLAAKLGLPIGKHVEVDLMRYVQRLEAAAENETKQVEINGRKLLLEEKEEARKTLEFAIQHGLLGPEEISRQLKKLLELEVDSTEPSLPARRRLVAREAEPLDFGFRVKGQRRRRQ